MFCKLPKCSLYSFWTDYGYEYECLSVHDQNCEDCLANYKNLGGLWNPETGNYVPRFIAFLKFGFVKRRNTMSKKLNI